MRLIEKKTLTKAANLKGYSVANLAAAVDLSPGHLYAILRGESTQPKTAKKIAKAVGIPLTELFDVTERKEQL